MAETRSHQQTSADEPLETGPRKEAADPLQESLDELANLADSLVDGLVTDEDDEPVFEGKALSEEEPASQTTEPVEPPAAASPVDEPHGTESGSVPDEEKSEPGPATWTLEEAEERERPDEDSTEHARRAAMKETLDALNELIDDKPPVTSKAIEVEGDRGEDISERLESVMSRNEQAGETETTLEADAGSTEVGSGETSSAEVSKGPGKNAPPVAPPDPTEETEVETSVAKGTEVATFAPAVAEPDVETVPATQVESPRRSKALWWVIAVVVIVAALAASYWVVNVRSTNPPATTTVEAPVPDPPVIYTRRPEIKTTSEPVQAAPVQAAPVPTEPVGGPVERLSLVEAVTTPAPANESTPSLPVPDPVQETVANSTETTESTAQPDPAVEPAAPPAVAETAAPEIAPAVVTAQETAPEAITNDPATDTPETNPDGASAPIPSAAASRGKTTETEAGQQVSAGIVDLSVPEIVASPEPGRDEMAAVEAPAASPRMITVEPVVDDPPVVDSAPADTVPVLIDRIEPVFDQRALRRGETQTVVLRVLVDERGRVVRVIVDETVPGSEAEIAAINAVLRWTYEPALESGDPVRSWTTERFEFSRPR